MRAGTPTG